MKIVNWTESRITWEKALWPCLGIILIALTKVRILPHCGWHHSPGWGLGLFKWKSRLRSSLQHSLLLDFRYGIPVVPASYCHGFSNMAGYTFEPWARKNCPTSLKLLLSEYFTKTRIETQIHGVFKTHSRMCMAKDLLSTILGIEFSISTVLCNKPIPIPHSRNTFHLGKLIEQCFPISLSSNSAKCLLLSISRNLKTLDFFFIK